MNERIAQVWLAEAIICIDEDITSNISINGKFVHY